MSKEFYDTTQNQNSPEELSYQPAYLKPKVQSKIQPKVYSKVQTKLMTDAGKQKKESSDVSTSHAKLPEEVQAKMETSFDQDFSEVNIHTSSNSAKDINAKAYTQGNDIHFAPGEYNPSTQPGQELIGHELTHVVQQKQGRVGPGEIHGKDLEINMDPSLEKEADDAGKLASTGNSIPPLSQGKSGIQFKLTGIDNSTLSEITTTGVSSTVAKGDKLEAGIESSQKMAESDWSSILLYAAIFKEVGDKYGVPGALLAAIASRESRGGRGLNEEGYGKSDSNGYGLMQIDKNANAALTGKEGAYSKEHIETATKLFVKLFEEIKTKHPDWTLAWKLRGAVAAYNFGSDDVRTQANIDKGSTGNDYSADIWERAKYYAQKKEFAESKNEAITNTSTTPATTTTTTSTTTTNTSSSTTTTATNQPAAKVYVPVYHEMPEVSESLLGVVGAPGAKTYTAEVINFVSDVSFLQKLMNDLGVLSKADYELESGQAGEELFVPTNWPAPEVPAPLSAVEKKLMDVYGKIPIGPQLPASLIPKTIQAIKTYQLEVMNAKVDGSVSSKGGTLASMQANTAEKVAIARNNYAIKKKQEAEALKKKKEEEAQKLAREQEEIKKQQAYIASLKSVGDDKESVKKIYDANIYDMRVLGKEMRKYAPYNPKLVIAMLKYMNYTDSDNLAYNITSNLGDAELGGLNMDLLKTLKDYLGAGWTEETEQKQIDRLNKSIGINSIVMPAVKTEDPAVSTATGKYENKAVTTSTTVYKGNTSGDKFKKDDLKEASAYISTTGASTLYGEKTLLESKSGVMRRTETNDKHHYQSSGKKFDSPTDYESSLDDFYKSREGKSKLTDDQIKLLEVIRKAANDQEYFNSVLKEKNAEGAKIDYSGSNLELEGCNFSPLLKSRIERFHKITYALGFFSSKILKTGKESVVRRRTAAHRFSVEYAFAIIGNYKNDLITNLIKMYKDSAFQSDDDIIDRNKNIWAHKKHFVDKDNQEVGEDSDKIDKDKTFKNVRNYILTLNIRDSSLSKKQAPASEGYEKGDDKRYPNPLNTINVSPHIVGDAIDIPSSLFGDFMTDPIIDYIALEFGIMRNTAPETWHFQLTGKPIREFEFEH